MKADVLRTAAKLDHRLLLARTLCAVAALLLASALAFPQEPAAASAQRSRAQSRRTEPSDVQAGLNDAQNAMDRGETAEAEAILRRLCQEDPQSFASHEALGLLLAAQSDFHAAVRVLRIAAAADPRSPVAHANLGIAYLKLNQPEPAAAELRLAVQLDPGNANAEAALGESLLLLGRWAQAASPLRAALDGGSSDPELPYDLALALFNSNRAHDAGDVLERSPGLEGSASSQSLLGDIDEKLGHYKEAAQHYVAAAEIDPSEENIYALGMEFLRHWTFDPATQEFALGVERYPGSTRMKLALGVAYYADQKLDRAITTIAPLVASDPGNSLATVVLGRSCTALAEGANPDCRLLLRAAALHPRDASLATDAAASLLRKTPAPADIARAEALLHRAVAANPRLAEARLELGVLLQVKEQWKESIAPLQTSLRLDPANAQAHYRLSRALAHEGRREDAQREIALYQQLSNAQGKDLDTRLKEITTLVVTMAPAR